MFCWIFRALNHEFDLLEYNIHDYDRPFSIELDMSNANGRPFN
jgi:hypothetical protein